LAHKNGYGKFRSTNLEKSVLSRFLAVERDVGPTPNSYATRKKRI
jgi:hypothetical protein